MSLLQQFVRLCNPSIAKRGRKTKKATRCRPQTQLLGEALEPRVLFAIDFDDQIQEAFNLGAMTANRSRTGQSINVATDVDMYRFSVTAGQRIAFDVDRPSGSLDSFLRLFNSSGQQLAANDDGPNPAEAASLESYTEFTFNTSGTFFVGVSGFGNQNYSATTGNGDANGRTGAYSLLLTRVTVAPPPPPADADPDDAINQAIALSALTQTRSRTGESISVGTDVDMFSFSVTAGQRIALDIDRPSGNFDSFLRLFDAAGNQLALNDDGPNPAEAASLESYTEFTFNTSGTFFVGVSGFGNQNYSATTGNGDTNGSTGLYSLTLSVVEVTPPPPPPASGFQITLAFSGLSASQQTIFNQAAARWSQIIVGDLPDVLFNGQTIDDVLISASSSPIDGVGNILGQAGPTNLRAGSFLPFRGTMQFDSADMANMEANGTLLEVILHEMGHVLGVGTIWSNLGLLQGAGTADPRFTGAQATAAFNQIFGQSASGVPVANVGGAGSRDSHWRESVFGNELMSPTIGGAGNPLSRITVGSMADMGYVVNMNAADAYTPPGAITSSGGSAGGATSGAGLFAEASGLFNAASLLDILAGNRLAEGGSEHNYQDGDDHDHVHLSLLAPVVGTGENLSSATAPRLATGNSDSGLCSHVASQAARHQVAVDQLMASLGNSLISSLR